MDVIVAGGHGKVGIRLLERLAARGDRARGLIRNPDHAPDLEAVGAEAVVVDLESEDPTPHLLDAHAIVFAAGAGPGSGDERKRSVDYGGCVKLLEGAQTLGIPRFVVVSSMGADEPDGGPEPMRPYLRAKAEADAAVQASDLAWTIVRPGHLTDRPPHGRVVAAERLGLQGEITRDDVADVLVAVLDTPTTQGLTFEVLEGDVPVAAAIAGLSAS
jgi:nucleoside-diphosphate-sugar epimerase